VNAAAVVFLTVSCISLTIHASALIRIVMTTTRGQIADLTDHGLIRTATSRTVVAVLYVSLGAYALTSIEAAGPVALAVFCVAQLTWQANALLDVRLKRRIAKTAQQREAA
jgi:hypothetical protein